MKGLDGKRRTSYPYLDLIINRRTATPFENFYFGVTSTGIIKIIVIKLFNISSLNVIYKNTATGYFAETNIVFILLTKSFVPLHFWSLKWYKSILQLIDLDSVTKGRTEQGINFGITECNSKTIRAEVWKETFPVFCFSLVVPSSCIRFLKWYKKRRRRRKNK